MFHSMHESVRGILIEYTGILKEASEIYSYDLKCIAQVLEYIQRYIFRFQIFLLSRLVIRLSNFARFHDELHGNLSEVDPVRLSVRTHNQILWIN